jgi:Transglycosylase-like domain
MFPAWEDTDMRLREPARHRKSRNPARPRRITVLAASAGAAVAAILAVTPGAGASLRTTAAPVPAVRAVTGTVISDGAARAAITQAEQAARVLRAGQSRTAQVTVTSWTVRPGQTLSGIAGSWCGAPADWTGLYAANKAVIGPDASLIQPGQRYSRGCYQTRAPPDPAPAASSSSRYGSDGKAWGVTYGYPYYCGDGDGDGYDVSCASIGRGESASAASGVQPREAVARAADLPAQGGYGDVSAAGYGGFQACVITRESGGSSQVMNSSGHYGLYQFSESTWEAYGGSAGSFGHASVAEQNQVFATAMAQGGQSNWSAYDGC